ncbi:hypothetical protein EVAR_31716_1 [Eumeta japonica]|uniref:DUF7041 domain-containing protein n=1 Tax=Eumeta variegata TaxID=151549 RepID=A0A4C1YQX0_EUMVA|nr:hypothetical protein EVAR_31716_1 [Eumeta japonica]
MAEKKQDDGDRSGGDYEAKGETTINRISVRVPPFYPTRPSLWFASLESQFPLAKITQNETKYHYAISQLEASYGNIAENVIMAPPAADKYQRFKTELIKRLTASRAAGQAVAEPRRVGSVQTIIAYQSKSTLEEISELADQIMDVTPSQQITAVSTNPGATSESNQIAALTRQVQALAAKLGLGLGLSVQ